MATKEKAAEVITTYKCVVCGKEFTAPGRRRRKFCSDECKRAYATKYNSTYVQNRRKTDEEFNARSKAANNASTMKWYAKNKWNSYLEHAEAILKLSQMKDNKILIAKYLDQNFVNRASGYADRTFHSEEEEKASNVLESLGDTYLTSN